MPPKPPDKGTSRRGKPTPAKGTAARPRPAAAPAKKMNPMVIGGIAVGGLVVVVVILVATGFFSKKEEEPEPGKKKEPAKESAEKPKPPPEPDKALVEKWTTWKVKFDKMPESSADKKTLLAEADELSTAFMGTPWSSDFEAARAKLKELANAPPPKKTAFDDTLAEARKSSRLAILVWLAPNHKDSTKFVEETMANPDVAAAMGKHCVCKMNPEGTDAENRLWQETGSDMPPCTIVFDPTGRMLTKVLTGNPKNYAAALNAAGPAYFSKILPARTSLEKNPEQPELLADMGSALVALDNPKESVKAYDAAIAMKEKKGDAQGTVRICVQQLDEYYEKKWYSEARGGCRTLLRLDAKNGKCPKAAWVLGMADCKEAKWADAITGLKAAADAYKDCDIMDKILFSLASAYMYSGDKATAIRLFDEIVAKWPESESANIAKTQAEKLRK